MKKYGEKNNLYCLAIWPKDPGVRAGTLTGTSLTFYSSDALEPK